MALASGFPYVISKHAGKNYLERGTDDGNTGGTPQPEN
jgi:hypothetical protein